MSTSSASTSNVQNQLTDKMLGLFDSVASERSTYYRKHSVPRQRDVQSIITHYAKANALISGGTTLIPGPFGMAAAIPELVLIMRNQIAMIYDIGMAYGHERMLRRELLAGVFVSALGTSSATLLTMHGGKVLVKRASLRVFQKVIALLAGKVTQQLLKSMISKWLPVIGAVAMAAWANYATNRIGKQARLIFDNAIEYAIDEEEHLADNEEYVSSEVNNIDQLKVHALINLMKIDGYIHPAEDEYIQTLIKNFSVAQQVQLQKQIAADECYPVDYAVFKNSPDEAIGLLLDLVALAQRDGQIHISEKIYIKQIGKAVGVAESDVDEMITE